MSDNNRKAATRQMNPSDYQLSRAYAGRGVSKSSSKLNQQLGQGLPDSKGKAALIAASAIGAGAKDYAKAAYHAGRGFVDGVSKQNPNSGRNLNNMIISRNISQGRQSQQNKPMQKPQASQTTNKGISAFRAKANGQAASKAYSAKVQSKGSGQGR